MDDFLQSIYLRQVAQECEYCFEAISRMNAILSRSVEGDFFREALDLVHHAAAVSRIFWPPGGSNKQKRQRAMRRGQFLRDSLGLQSGHPIQDRTLRDHFEHFDERLDAWAEESPNRNIVQSLIGPRSAIGGDAIKDSDIIRHYDPNTKMLGFRGEMFDVQDIATGIEEIHKKVAVRLGEIEANKRLKPTLQSGAA